MALIQPPIIVYNLKDRGRKFRGIERNFNIPKIVAAINSPMCQERVKTRGMLGFLGHWGRVKFGLDPAEWGMNGGKWVVAGDLKEVEPAIVTTHLKAYLDGRIEHKTEFLDNPMGQLASRMYVAKVGGFSSAINPNIPEFYGFDWVNDPNYNTNRGYDMVLDSVSGGVDLGDVVAAEYAEQISMMRELLKHTEYREQIALDSAVVLRQENNELLDLLSTTDSPKIKISSRATNRFEDNMNAFDCASGLPSLMGGDLDPVSSDEDVEYESLRARYLNV